MVLAYYCECSADTWGSEIGILSPNPYLLLLPGKPVPAGTNGGISILGMSAAVGAGVTFSILYYLIQPSGLSVFVKPTLYYFVAVLFHHSSHFPLLVYSGNLFRQLGWKCCRGKLVVCV